MIETSSLRSLLLPEMESEFAKTRKLIQAIPESNTAFRPHDKSMPLSRLAGHCAGLAGFITQILTTPGVEATESGRLHLVMITVPQLLAEFDELADKAVTAMKECSDQAFYNTWEMTHNGKKVYGHSRYMAYRELGLNHMIHHRGQLSVYVRMLDAYVPGTFGPSADDRAAAAS